MVPDSDLNFGQRDRQVVRVNHESFKNVAEGIQSIITSLALVTGGSWALWRFVLNRESAPKIDLDIDLSFVRQQGDSWIVEGVALVKNPGTVRLDFKRFTYELHYALSSDNFGSQTTEEGVAKKGIPTDSFRAMFKESWLEDCDYTYLEPGERSRYSFLAFPPANATMLVLLCEFYDAKEHVESIRKTYPVPAVTAN